MNPSIAIARNEFRQLRRTPSVILFTLLMPLAMMTVVRGANRQILAAEGLEGTNGAGQSVAGLTVMFVLLGAGTVGWMFFREHQWRTWDRLRASPASPINIIIGKATPNMLILVSQQAILFVLGIALFDLTIKGPLIALALVMVALSSVVISFGVAATSLVTRWDTMNNITSLGAVVMAGVGGAFMPLSTLPNWLQTIAPITPTYWAMRAYTAVIHNRPDPSQTALSVLMLVAFAAALTTLAATRFRFDEPKGM